MSETITFADLAKRIADRPPKHRQRIIAVDGGGGAGKSTFSSHLQKAIAGSHLVKVDDFYRPPQLRAPLESTRIINPNFDWDRLRASVLEAVKDDREISYRLYDFDAGTLSGEFVSIPSDATLIVEGVWSLQASLTGFYDYRIWIETPADIRIKRGVARDGEELRDVWEQEWIPIDEHYRQTHHPERQADLIVDGLRSDYSKDAIAVV